MPQLSPLWYLNLISWTYAILTFIIWYLQVITFPNLIRLNLARKAVIGNSNCITT